MTRINLFRTTILRATQPTLNSVTWGKNLAQPNLDNKTTDNTSVLMFAALLIACSMAVGCSSEKPQTSSSIPQSPMAQPTPTTNSSPVATPVAQAVAKPVHKKVVRKLPPTVTYTDEVTGISFQYPRKYNLKTGDAADALVSSDPVPMDFVQPGGVALAAVALPDSLYPHSDLASAFFNISVNKALTADQCSEFLVLQPNPASPAHPAIQATAQLTTSPISKSETGKLMIGDMELVSSETNTTEENKDSREESSKYFHVFQNGACYEFALKIATTKLETPATTKPSPNQIKRDEVFQRLEKILATVKIDPVVTPEVNAEVKTNASPMPAETPAQ